jgi:hypothetical protein
MSHTSKAKKPHGQLYGGKIHPNLQVQQTSHSHATVAASRVPSSVNAASLSASMPLSRETHLAERPKRKRKRHTKKQAALWRRQNSQERNEKATTATVEVHTLTTAQGAQRKSKLKKRRRVEDHAVSPADIAEESKASSHQHNQRQTLYPQEEQHKSGATTLLLGIGKRGKKSSASKRKGSAVLKLPFPTEYGDHFETPTIAYRHIVPVLDKICSKLNKDRTSLVIYDPYYCAGSMVRHLGDLGFPHVINQKRDFYKDIARNRVPDFDILVTNPPYSGEHKKRCVEFAVQRGKPWLLLMPNYVATKQYLTATVGQRADHKNQGPCYVHPATPYQYAHPEGTGHAESPFDSLWFVHGAGLLSHRDVQSAYSAAHDIRSLPQRDRCDLYLTTDELRSNGIIRADKRMNPRRRRKLRSKFGLK